MDKNSDQQFDRSKPEPRAKERDSEQNTGLCASCVHCTTCDRPRPEGGVWRCEDYEEQR